jgi:hypothetical protein
LFEHPDAANPEKVTGDVFQSEPIAGARILSNHQDGYASEHDDRQPCGMTL